METAPNKVYAWGLFNQNVSINQIVEPGYTMCWAAKWEGSREVMFDSVWDSTSSQMIKGIWKLLDEADAVVHYNGTKFDIPTLNWEFAQEELGPPTPYHQIDLFRTVKQRFRSPSKKLDFVSQILGIGQKFSHKGMELWTGCMDGVEKDWKIMERYNKQDVRLLPKLYKKLLPWIKNHPNHALFKDTTRPVCPNCGGSHVVKKGVETTTTMQYQRYKCKDCGTPIRGRTAITDKEKRSHVLVASKL